MKKINTYIIEKLKINKNSKLKNNIEEIYSFIEVLFNHNKEFKNNSSEILNFIQNNIDDDEYILCFDIDDDYYKEYIKNYLIDNIRDIKNDNIKLIKSKKWNYLIDKYFNNFTNNYLNYENHDKQFVVRCEENRFKLTSHMGFYSDQKLDIILVKKADPYRI